MSQVPAARSHRLGPADLRNYGRRRVRARRKGAATVTGSEQTARWLAGRAQPPTWFRLVGVLFAVLFGIPVAVSLADKRGAIVGTVAGVVYGLPGLYLLAWQRMAGWSTRHRLLDSLLVVPLLFLALAYLTKLSDGVCLLIALLGGLPLVGLGAALRHRRRRRT